MIYRPRLVHRTQLRQRVHHKFTRMSAWLDEFSSWLVHDHSFRVFAHSPSVPSVPKTKHSPLERHTSWNYLLLLAWPRYPHAIANEKRALGSNPNLNEIRKKRKAQHGPRKRKLRTEEDDELVTEIGRVHPHNPDGEGNWNLKPIRSSWIPHTFPTRTLVDSPKTQNGPAGAAWTEGERGQ